MPLSTRHEFKQHDNAEQMPLARCLPSDSVCSCARLAKVLSLFFHLRHSIQCTHSLWKCSRVQTWYWISQNTFASQNWLVCYLMNATPLLEKWSTGALTMEGSCTPSLQYTVTLQTDSIKTVKSLCLLLISSITLDSLSSLDQCLLSLSSWLPWTSFFYLMTSLYQNIPWSL